MRIQRVPHSWLAWAVGKLNLLVRKSGPRGHRKSDSRCAMSDTDAKIAGPSRYAEAHRKGYLAGRRGCTGADNPYENDSREARAWVMGLLDGRAKQLTLVR